MPPSALSDAATAVQRGGVVLYPTETVYGLGCDPRHTAAVERIRRLKGRDADKPMLAVTDRWGRVERWIADLSDAHRRLMQATDSEGLPLAVTLLFSPGPDCPDALIGPGGLVGIRRTSDTVCRTLISACGTAILSTSANPAGEPPPSLFEAVDASILAGVDAAVDAGRPLHGTPSTVVRVAEEGAVTAARVQEVASG